MARTYYARLKRSEKLSKDKKVELFLDLINSFSIIKSPSESALFIQDLLTASEIMNLSVRLRIAKLLLASLTYKEISEQTHASTATITKVSQWLSRGGEGFKKVVGKLPLRWEKPSKIPRGPIEFHLPELIFATARYTLAKSQGRKVEKLMGRMEEKRRSDKLLRKEVGAYYLDKKTRKQS